MTLEKQGAIAGSTLGWDTTSTKQIMLVAGAMIGLALGFAVVYFGTLGVFLKPIAGEFGWSRGETSSIVSVALLGSAIGTPLLGVLVDRIGPVRPLLICVLALSMALYVFSILPNNRPLFAGLSFLFGIVAIGTGPSIYLAGLQHAFDRRLGLALGIAMAGLGIGATFAPSMAQVWVANEGWRGAYQILAVLALGGGLIATALIAFGQPLHARIAEGSMKTGTGFRLGEAMRDWRFWGLCLAIFLGTSAGLGTVVHTVPLLTDRGLTPATAAQVAGGIGMGLVVGRLGSGFLMDLIFAPLVGAAGFLLGIVGLMVIASQISTAFVVIAPAALLVGLALGVEGDFAAFAVRRYFGNRSFGSVYGIVYAFYTLGGVVGPTLFGLAFDRFGGYGAILVAAMIAFLIAMMLLLALGPYRFALAKR